MFSLTCFISSIESCLLGFWRDSASAFAPCNSFCSGFILLQIASYSFIWRETRALYCATGSLLRLSTHSHSSSTGQQLLAGFSFIR
ncbi:hypothetical protein GDO78_018006 [Eleutherodactylus coqui]|uniref:Uncharacterized protein n=1 Tax=Eleutherodactylus coqui TaxID=57060 RepID=A0A8J6E9Q2_ELECQ|nr:hypothetical protein GDO78_018006 [Eleutherodactylus coqui]